MPRGARRLGWLGAGLALALGPTASAQRAVAPLDALPKGPRVRLEQYRAEAPAFRLVPAPAPDPKLGKPSPVYGPHVYLGDLDGDGLDDLAALLFGPPLPSGLYEARVVVFHRSPNRTYDLVEVRYAEVPRTATVGAVLAGLR